MVSPSLLDAVLSSATRRGADAVVFAAGDRPRLYLDGESKPFSRPERVLDRADVSEVASMVLPEHQMEQLEAGRTSHTFCYGADRQIAVTAEGSTDGLRVMFWLRPAD